MTRTRLPRYSRAEAKYVSHERFQLYYNMDSLGNIISLPMVLGRLYNILR